MNEPTEQEINEGLARFEGWKRAPDRRMFGGWVDPDGFGDQVPTYTTSLDDCRRVMGKMTEEQQTKIYHHLWDVFAPIHTQLWRDESNVNHSHIVWWLLFTMPPATLARAIYEVMKGDK